MYSSDDKSNVLPIMAKCSEHGDRSVDDILTDTTPCFDAEVRDPYGLMSVHIGFERSHFNDTMYDGYGPAPEYFGVAMVLSCTDNGLHRYELKRSHNAVYLPEVE